MAVKQVKNVAEIPSEELDDWGPVELPISETVSQLRGVIVNENPDGSEAGIWECTPGTWTRQVMDAEISSEEGTFATSFICLIAICFSLFSCL